MFKLTIEDDEGKTTVVPLRGTRSRSVGSEGNTIRLTERNVSRRHARLLRQNGALYIEDLASFTGVRVNGTKIAARDAAARGRRGPDRRLPHRPARRADHRRDRDRSSVARSADDAQPSRGLRADGNGGRVGRDSDARVGGGDGGAARRCPVTGRGRPRGARRRDGIPAARERRARPRRPSRRNRRPRRPPSSRRPGRRRFPFRRLARSRRAEVPWCRILSPARRSRWPRPHRRSRWRRPRRPPAVRRRSRRPGCSLTGRQQRRRPVRGPAQSAAAVPAVSDAQPTIPIRALGDTVPDRTAGTAPAAHVRVDDRSGRDGVLAAIARRW